MTTGHLDDVTSHYERALKRWLGPMNKALARRLEPSRAPRIELPRPPKVPYIYGQPLRANEQPDITYTNASPYDSTGLTYPTT